MANVDRLTGVLDVVVRPAPVFATRGRELVGARLLDGAADDEDELAVDETLGGVEVADGDGPAIETGRCRNSIDTITIRSISNANNAVSSQNTRRGISGPWSSAASTSTGSDSGTSTFTTNGSLRFSPFQKYFLGRARTRTNVAV